MGRFDGKTVLITGAARGQGRAHALAFAREGANVVVTDIAESVRGVPYPSAGPEDLKQTVSLIEDLDRRALAMVVDVRDQGALNDAAATAINEFGRVDVLVANAGILTMQPILEMTDETWSDTIDINLTGVWRAIRAVGPHMVQQQAGSIVLVASVNGVEAAPGMAHYVSAKHGVLGLMKTAALELGAHRIRVNAIGPGFIDTPMTDWQGCYDMTGGHPGSTRAEHERASHHWPVLGGLGLMSADMVSGTVLYLASEDAAGVTGTFIPVDGGHLVLQGFNHNPSQS